VKSSSDFNFSKEASLIISFLRGERLKEKDFSEINWMSFVKILKDEEIYPLFYEFLKDKDFVPVKVKELLKFLCKKNRERVECLKDETIFVLKKLKQKGIKAIPLRGFLLSEEVYEKVYLRVFSDIDLFVMRKDLEKAIETLKDSGFSFNIDPQEERFLRNFHFKFYNEYKLYKKNFLVEIHFDLLPHRFKYTGNFENFIEVEKVKIDGLEIYKFSREWEVIMVAVHAFLHRFSLLKFILDIHCILSKFHVDYNKVFELSKRFRILKMVKLSLTLSSILFHTKIPGFLKFNRIPDFLRDFMFKEDDPSALKKDLLSILFIDSFPQKIHYLSSLLNPDKRIYRILPLPRFLYFFYYPLRVLFILKRRLIYFV